MLLSLWICVAVAAPAVSVELQVEKSEEHTVSLPVLPEYKRPQNPGLSKNPFSSQHGDSYLSDTSNVALPANATITVEHDIATGGFCYTAAFNGKGDRLLLLCHSLDLKTHLALLWRSTDRACWADPQCNTMMLLDKFDLDGVGKDSGIYFYIDNQDHAVVANMQRLQWFNITGDKLQLLRSIDLSAYLADGKDFITSAFPDWQGLIWWESHRGRVGTIAHGSISYWDPEDDGGFPAGSDGEANWIMKGFSIDESGVYVLTNSHLIKFVAAKGHSKPLVAWNYTYNRGSAKKTANLQSWGSDTSPTLLGESKEYVAIMNNADPAVEVNVFDRSSGQLVCRRPMWRNTYRVYFKDWHFMSCEMRSATLASFIGYRDSMFMGNYWGFDPLVGVPGAPGYSRVDVVDNGVYGKDAPMCKLVWEKGTSISSGCLKMSTHSGLVYNTLRRDRLWAPEVCEHDPAPQAASGYDLEGLQYGHNYLEGVDVGTGERKYLYDLGAGQFFKGWTFTQVNQVGPLGEFYVGKFNGFKALYDPH